MKKVSGRALCALALAVVLVLGLAAFALKYAVSAGDWVTFPGSPHIYAGANLDCGVVTDRAGALLLDTTDGRTYSENAVTRASTMHILGDRYGYISAPLLSVYADDLIGYSKVQGLYGQQLGDAAAQLTISADVQNAALSALAGYRGTIGVYNYQTGEILCAVTSPSYDPDNMPDVENDTTGAYNGVYVNRFFSTTYTPGSIFKLVTAAAALENIEDIQTRQFRCDGACVIGGQQIICNGVHGTLDFAAALAHSCNVAFGQVAQELGAKTLQKYAQKLGLTDSFSCDGYKTAAGVIDLSKADDGDVAWAGIGQYTDQVNAYAFLRYMGVIAGGGEAAEPYLMQSVRVGESTRYDAETRTTGQLLGEQAAAQLTVMMRNDVSSIYGDWQFGGLNVCAKSGTAEIEGQAAHAMFAGFVQDAAYPLAFVVFVENGGSGSGVAAPIAAKVLAACVQAMANS